MRVIIIIFCRYLSVCSSENNHSYSDRHKFPSTNAGYINHANLQEMLWNATVSDTDHCAEGSDFSALILHVTPYLYPFSIIEYSILVCTHYARPK